MWRASSCFFYSLSLRRKSSISYSSIMPCFINYINFSEVSYFSTLCTIGLFFGSTLYLFSFLPIKRSTKFLVNSSSICPFKGRFLKHHLHRTVFILADFQWFFLCLNFVKLIILVSCELDGFHRNQISSWINWICRWQLYIFTFYFLVSQVCLCFWTPLKLLRSDSSISAW